MYTLQKRGAMDPQLDSPLQRNCVAEIKELCSDIPPNRGFKLVNCLNKKKSEVRRRCDCHAPPSL